MRKTILHGAAFLTLCAKCLPAQDAPAAQTASVTFYSGGSLLGSALPSSSSGVFEGCIFEDKQAVACITHHEFMNVHLTPGSHTFSASLSERHPANNSQLELTVEAGKNYYVRAVRESKAFKHVVGASLGRLDTVPCKIAEDETRDSREVSDNGTKSGHVRLKATKIPPCV